MWSKTVCLDIFFNSLIDLLLRFDLIRCSCVTIAKLGLKQLSI